jgi:CHAT domain-containing protein
MPGSSRVGLATVAVMAWLFAASPLVFSQQLDSGRSSVEMPLRDVETAAGLVATGKLFYDADADKLSWSRYCSNSLALANRGEFRQAVREASKALYLGESTNNATALAYASRDLAYAYNLAGELNRAEEWARRSLTYLGRSQTRDRRAVLVPVHKVLGDIAARQDDLDSAQGHYKKALGESYPVDRPALMTSIANVEIRRGKLDEARRIIGDIDSEAESWRPFILRVRGQIEFAERNYSKAAEYYLSAVASVRNIGDPYHEMWLQHGLARAYAATNDRDKALAALREAISSATRIRGMFRSEEFKAGFFGDVQQIFDDAIGLLMDSGHVREALELSEESRARVLLELLRGGAGEQELNTKQAIDELPQHTAVVVYHVLRDRTIAWTVRRGTVSAAIVPAGRNQIAALTGRFRRAILNRAHDVRQQGSKLYELLVQPLGLHDGETFIVVPHKALHYLPVHALSGPRGYLIEERSVASVPSVNSLHEFLAASMRDKLDLFALGNPDLEGPQWALPGAEREVKEIGGLFAGAEVFTGKDASKSRFVMGAPGRTLIHVAAHASVDEIDPMYSTIRLARSGQARGDLEAHEVSKLDLSSARLVTLSACDSGLGKVNGGDEFFGFKRALLAAGSKSLLLSLWPVEDQSTVRLMSVFYQNLRERPMIEALREAQLALLGSADYASPMFWASFVLVGQWR